MKKNNVFKIIRYCYLGIVSLIIIILSVFLICSLTSKNGYTSIFGYSFFEVESFSMYPELDKGNLVVVKKRDDSMYKVGMTVTYIKDGDVKPTTHKIVKIEGSLITTRGIYKEITSDDEPFDVSYIIGEVVCVWKSYGKIRDFVTNPLGIITILLCGFLFIEGFNYLESSYKEKNLKKE